MPNSRADNPTLLAQFTAKEDRIGQLIEKMNPLISVAEDEAGVEAYFMHVDPTGPRFSSTKWMAMMPPQQGTVPIRGCKQSSMIARRILAEREVVEGSLIGSKHINLRRTEPPMENPR
jgi:hypothetical protein